MWSSPNTIPGTPMGTIRLPNDKTCPHCNLPFREVIQKIDKDGLVTYHCPHCDTKVNIKVKNTH